MSNFTEAEFNEYKMKHDCVIAYFSTPNCRVCGALLPKIERIADEKKIPFVFLDTTILRSIAGQLLVFAVPTIIIFLFNKEFARFSRHFATQSFDKKLEQAIEIAALNQNLSNSSLFGSE